MVGGSVGVVRRTDEGMYYRGRTGLLRLGWCHPCVRNLGSGGVGLFGGEGFYYFKLQLLRTPCPPLTLRFTLFLFLSSTTEGGLSEGVLLRCIFPLVLGWS